MVIFSSCVSHYQRVHPNTCLIIRKSALPAPLPLFASQNESVEIRHRRSSRPMMISGDGGSLVRTYINVYLYICIYIYIYICLSVCLSVRLSVCLSVYLSIYRSISLSVYLSIYLHTCTQRSWDHPYMPSYAC